MGFTGHINGKILKTSFSHAYKFLVHCVVHALSHRKGAYDETSDYIMNIITCLILNRPYNVSQVIFDYMAENARAGNKQYIMYPRFVQMMINDQFKDLEKRNDDILGLRHMTADTISRLIKGPNPGAKGKICKIKTPAYVAPENDAWRHQDSDSENENKKMSDMIEKENQLVVRERWEKEENSQDIPCRASVEPQQRLIDETVLEPSKVIEQGTALLKQTLESYLKRNEEVRAQKDQGSSAQAENVKVTEPECEAPDDSSEDDSEATQFESELDPTTLQRGKAQLKKKSTKKQKALDEEDSTYEPDEPKKEIKKRKVVQAGVIPRRVRAKKFGTEPPKDKGGKKEKHLEMSKILETEKAQSVEIPKEPEVQNVEVPVVEVQKKTSGDDYVEITGYKAATTPLPPPQDKPESSHPKDTNFDYMFEGLPTATGIYTEDIPEDDYDMFNNEAVNELMKKVAELEKEKAKVEAERNSLKKRIEELMMANDQIRLVLIDQEEKLENNSKIFDVMQEEIAKLNKELEKQNDINQTLNQLISEIFEASANEIRAIKLEMEAMKADKVMKDNQLSMLTAIIESHLKVDIHVAFNEVGVKRAEERRVKRERLLAQEATERRKSVVEDVVGSSRQNEAGGSSSQVDIEMVDAKNIQEQDVEAGQDYMRVGESSESFDPYEIIRRVTAIQKKKKAKEMLLLEWKTQQFVLVGKASTVPYSVKEIARQIKIKERRRKAKIACGEIVDDDSDVELFRD
ncbi:hypothetical protein HanPI659440_Chr04g0153411 [Helianthus annuus]|nr:hypothetical protein HanPI659440_Chr04g0153411 [Helianthus annuus]